MASIKLLVEFNFEVGDPKAARILADLIKKRDETSFNEDYGIWDFSPSEKIIEAVVKE